MATPVCSTPTWSEEDRLAALERYGILDTGREAAFDDMAALVADLLDAPMAVVNLIAADRQWFKAEVGIGADSLPLDVSICRHAILQPGVMVVPDLRDDPRFEGNSLIHVDGGLRFYAGALLETPDGLPLGTICVLDREPRPQGLSQVQSRALGVLASQAMAQIELRRAKDEAQAAAGRQAFLLALEERLHDLADPDAILSAALAILGEHLGLDRVGYTEIIDSATVRMTGCHTANGLAPLTGEFPLESFGEARIARQRQGLTEASDDVQADPEQDTNVWAAIDTRAFVSVPLVREGQFRASLYVNSRNPRRWTPEDVTLIEQVAARTWDAVERARAEARLRASEARFRLMADATPQIIWITDRHGRMEFFNRQFTDYTGEPGREATPAEIAAEFMHPEDGADVVAAFEAALASGEPFEIEHRIRSAAGEYRWFLARAEPYRDPETGEIVRWFGASVDIHDRRQTEAELRESEEHLRAIVETATDYAIFTTDPAGLITTWPAGAQEVFGWSAAEAIGQPVDMTFVPEDRDIGAPETERITARTAGQCPNVRWHLRRDGSRVFIDGVTRPLQGEDGVVTGFVKVGQDVTERRAIEEALRASEAQFRAFAQAVPDHVWAARSDGALYWFNDQVYAYCGEAPGSLDGSGWARIVHPDDRPDAARTWAHALATGEVYETEFRIRRADGCYRWFLVRAEPVCGEGGSVSNWVGTNTDIHDRRRAEEALRQVNETLEARVAERTAERDRMWETSPDLMLVIDFEGVFRRVNPAWTMILGYAPEELVGHHVNEFVLPDDHEETVGAYELAAHGGQPRIVNRYRHKDGSLRWISWTAAPAGDMTYATGRDITAEKERQAELEAAQEQLRQSQKMEAMGQLTGGVAHDFNNLLTPIIGSLDRLLTRGLGSPRERQLMDGALQSAERAKILVQRLLAFARRQPLQPRAVNVGELVGNMAELITSTTGPRIEVQVELPDDLPPALADANQLEMALLNLAVNARDAMPDGGELTISAARESVRIGRRTKLRPGHYIRLSVQDTGLGMDEATLARAVEPFFSTKGVGKGTGLGLSMVHGLALQLGGELTITSHPGQGTTVSMWLPLSAVAVEEDGQGHAVTAAPEAQGTALLVDDEDLVRMSTTDMLIDLGYEVVEATSAEEALQQIQGGLYPDLVVTDHLMPGMSGVDLARELRSSRPDLPVLIVSGYAEMEGIAPGFPRLTKPFRASELAASLAALIPDGKTEA